MILYIKVFSKYKMFFSLKNLYFFLRLILFLSIIWLGTSKNLFALPIKTSIMNAEEKKVGQALVYIDYVELQDMEGTAKGRLGFVNIKGGFQLAHYDWSTFWSYVYAPDGTKIGEAKCIAFRGICSAGIASYLTGLLDQ